jgi:hypothetical protein
VPPRAAATGAKAVYVYCAAADSTADVLSKAPACAAPAGQGLPAAGASAVWMCRQSITTPTLVAKVIVTSWATCPKNTLDPYKQTEANKNLNDTAADRNK